MATIAIHTPAAGAHALERDEPRHYQRRVRRQEKLNESLIQFLIQFDQAKAERFTRRAQNLLRERKAFLPVLPVNQSENRAAECEKECSLEEYGPDEHR